MEDVEKKYQIELTVKGLSGREDAEKFANELIEAYLDIPNRHGLTVTYVGREEGLE